MSSCKRKSETGECEETSPKKSSSYNLEDIEKKQKLSMILRREIDSEIKGVREDLETIQERIFKTQQYLIKVRQGILTECYKQADKGLLQKPLHPAVKTVLVGKSPCIKVNECSERWEKVNENDFLQTPTNEYECSGYEDQTISHQIIIKEEQSEANCESTDYTNVDSDLKEHETEGNLTIKKESLDEDNKFMKTPRYIPPKNYDKGVLKHCEMRENTVKQKIRVVVGNVSKWLEDQSQGATHKWSVYVKFLDPEIDATNMVEKIKFFLHPSYKPNDVLFVEKPPYKITRRGWGEFPLRVQIHFVNKLNKPVDVIHNLKLDNTHSGLEMFGCETKAEMWIHPILQQEDVVKDGSLVTSQLTKPFSEMPQNKPSSSHDSPEVLIKSEPMVNQVPSLTDNKVDDAHETVPDSKPLDCEHFLFSSGLVEPPSEPSNMHSSALYSNESVELCESETISQQNPMSNSISDTFCTDSDFGWADNIFDSSSMPFEVSSEVTVETEEWTVNEKLKDESFELGPRSAYQDTNIQVSNHNSSVECINFDYSNPHFSSAENNDDQTLDGSDTIKNVEQIGLEVNTSIQSNSTDSTNVLWTLKEESENIKCSVISEPNINRTPGLLEFQYPETLTNQIPENKIINNETEKLCNEMPKKKLFLKLQNGELKEVNGRILLVSGNVMPLAQNGPNTLKEETKSFLKPPLRVIEENAAKHSYAAVTVMPRREQAIKVNSSSKIQNMQLLLPTNDLLGLIPGSLNKKIKILNSAPLKMPTLTPFPKSKVPIKSAVVPSKASPPVALPLKPERTELKTLGTKGNPPKKIQDSGGCHRELFPLSSANSQINNLKAVANRPNIQVESSKSLTSEDDHNFSLDRNIPKLSESVSPKKISRPKLKSVVLHSTSLALDKKTLIVQKKMVPGVSLLKKTEVKPHSSRKEGDDSDLKNCPTHNTESAVHWMLKRHPLVDKRAESHLFKMRHPYCAGDEATFQEWPLPKQRASEWLRAKTVNRMLSKFCSNLELWSTSEVYKWARSRCFTPTPKNKDVSLLPDFEPDVSFCYSAAPDISNWIKNYNTSINDMEVDVINTYEDLEPAGLEGKTCLLKDKLHIPLEVELHHFGSFVGECCKKVDVVCSDEEIIPDVLYPGALRLIITAFHSIAEDLIRRSHEASWFRFGEVSPPSIDLIDVKAAILSRPEFDLFTNEGLGAPEGLLDAPVTDGSGFWTQSSNNVSLRPKLADSC